MKNTFIKPLSFLFLLFSNLVSFAQTDPGSTDNYGTLEGTDTPAAPIDSHLIWLVSIGLVYVLYFFYTRRKALVKQ